MGNKKHSTCLITLLQNELNSDVGRFTTHIKPVLQQISFLTGLNKGGKTRNIAIQLVLQQCCKTGCTFLLPVSSKLNIHVHLYARFKRGQRVKFPWDLYWQNNKYELKRTIMPVLQSLVLFSDHVHTYPDILISNFFFPDKVIVDTYPLNPAYDSATF